MKKYKNPDTKRYKVIISYTESRSHKKLFKIEYTVEAGNRRFAIKEAEDKFNMYNSSSNASWTRFIVYSKIRAWRLIEGLPQTPTEIDSFAGSLEFTQSSREIVKKLKVLGSIEDSSLSSKIIKFFNHKDMEVINTAIEALGNIGDPGDFAPVMREYNKFTNSKIKATALIAAAKLALPEDELLPVLYKELKNKDARVRANAIEAITILGDMSQESEKRVISMLEDENSRVKANAIIYLWPGYDHTKLLEILKQMVSCEIEETKLSAVYVLSNIPIPGRLELLFSLARGDEFLDVRTTAKESLFNIKDTACIPYWIRLIETEEDFSKITRQVVSLGEGAISPLLSFEGETKEHKKNASLLLDQLEQQILRNKSWMDWLKAKQKRLFKHS